MAKERTTLWLLGAGAATVLGFLGVRLYRINEFLKQFTFTFAVTNIRFVDSNLWNFPPVPGNILVTTNITIANPLNSSHAITDFSIRIFDITDGETQIGYSQPISQKIVIPAASSTVIRDVKLLIPVMAMFKQFTIESIKNIYTTQQLRLNRKYRCAVHLRLNGFAGNTDTTITI